MSVQDTVASLVAPLVSATGLDLYDVEYNGGILRVLVDGHDGVDIGRIQDLSRRISRMLDEHDPIPGRYTLEVSSPGLERKLRTTEHFRGAIGEQVKIKLFPGGDELRRREGRLVDVSDEHIILRDEAGDAVIALDSISGARTVFDWGPGVDNEKLPARSKKTSSKKKSGAASHDAAAVADDTKEAANS